MAAGTGLPIVYITRKESFSACHRLHNPSISSEENLQIYGKCNHPNGHGHNYIIEVTVKGIVDDKTGMVMNLVLLSSAMKTYVLDIMDHKNIDLDVPYFKNVTSTAENIAVFIWKQLESHLPSNSLYKVKVIETDKNSATYKGEVYTTSSK